MAKHNNADSKPVPQHRPRRFAHVKAVVYSLVCALPVVGGGWMLFNGSWLPAAIYLALSAIAVLLYWRDKRQARADGWRTPEKVLHAVELLGGWPGALLAQQLFRHKTRKLSFQLVFWLIVLLHEVVWADYLFFAGRYITGHLY
jgi:uncharacterized membrane protein YsdA (DUF1294 family)